MDGVSHLRIRTFHFVSHLSLFPTPQAFVGWAATTTSSRPPTSPPGPRSRWAEGVGWRKAMMRAGNKQRTSDSDVHPPFLRLIIRSYNCHQTPHFTSLHVHVPPPLPFPSPAARASEELDGQAQGGPRGRLLDGRIRIRIRILGGGRGQDLGGGTPDRGGDQAGE